MTDKDEQFIKDVLKPVMSASEYAEIDPETWYDWATRGDEEKLLEYIESLRGTRYSPDYLDACIYILEHFNPHLKSKLYKVLE